MKKSDLNSIFNKRNLIFRVWKKYLGNGGPKQWRFHKIGEFKTFDQVKKTVLNYTFSRGSDVSQSGYVKNLKISDNKISFLTRVNTSAFQSSSDDVGVQSTDENKWKIELVIV